MVSTTPKPFVFVLMPFAEDFDDVYKLGILPACKAAGAVCERVDEQIFTESIMDRVRTQIAKADIIVSDMTGQNPNVFYEVGYAHALDKPTILVTQRADDIPFDLKHAQHIVYGNSVSNLQRDLKKKVKHFVDHPEKKRVSTAYDLEYHVNGHRIHPKSQPHVNLKTSDHSSDHGWTLNIAIFNAGTRSVDMEHVRFRLVHPVALGEPDRIEQFTQIPGERYLIGLYESFPLMPKDWIIKAIRIRNAQVASMNKTLPGGNPANLVPNHFPCMFRTVTEFGAEEYPFTIWIQ